MDKMAVHYAVGKQYATAYDFCLELLQELGGLKLHGVPAAVWLTMADDFSDSGVLQKSAQLALEQGFKLFLGPIGHSLSLLAADTVDGKGLIMNPVRMDPQFYANSSYIFGMSPYISVYLAPAFDAVTGKGARTVSYLWMDRPGTRYVCSYVPEIARERGMTVLSGHGIRSAHSNEMTDAVSILLQEQPDVVVGCLYDKLCMRFLAEARARDLNPRAIILTNSDMAQGVHSTHDALFSVGVEPSPSIVTPLLGGPSISRSEFSAYWASFSGSTKPMPNDGVIAFNAMALLLQAVQWAGSDELGRVAYAINHLTADGVTDQYGRIPVSAHTFQYDNFGPEIWKVTLAPREGGRDIKYPRPRWQDWPCYYSTGPYKNVGVTWDAALDREVCTECPPGRFSQFNVVAKCFLCEGCPAGKVLALESRGGTTISALCTRCGPGRFASSSGTCEACAKGRFQDLALQTTCHECSPGRVQMGDGATVCSACQGTRDSGGVLYSDNAGMTQCESCLEGGLCEMNADGLFATVTNRDRYYLWPREDREHGAEHRPKIFFCPHGRGDACRARGRCWHDEEGRETMEGPMCGRCRAGFGRSGPASVCKACPHIGVMLLTLLGYAVLAGLVVAAVMGIICSTDYDRPSQLGSCVAKQVINYVQMASVVVLQANSDVVPQSLSAAVEALLALTTLRGAADMFSVSCFATEFFPYLPYWKFHSLFSFFIVPILLVLSSLGFQVFAWARVRLGYERVSWRRRVTLVVVILFLSLSLASAEIVVSLTCFPFDAPRLMIDPSVKCEIGLDSNLVWWVLNGGAFAVISLGPPLVFYIILRRYERAGTLHNVQNLRMIGFLTCGFEKQCWYFECVFMVRKVLFIVCPHLPITYGQSQDDLELVQNATLFIIAAGFLGLHLYCQPYDNRGYYILDRIETASLTAISATPLLIVAGTRTDSLSMFKASWARILRDILIVAVLLLLHGHTLLLVFWGFLRGAVMNLLRELDSQARGRRRWVRILLLRLSYNGAAKITADGFELSGVSGISEKLLCDLVQDVVRMHIKHSGRISYANLIASLQRMLVETRHLRDIEAYQLRSPARFYLRLLKRRVDQLPCFKGLTQSVIERLEGFLRSKGYNVSVKDSGGKGAMTKMDDNARASAILDPGGLAPFNEEHVEETIGDVYAIEEMYAGLIRLGDAAYQEASQQWFDEDQPVNRVSMLGDASRGLELVKSLNLDDHVLSRSEVHDSELRGLRSEIRSEFQEELKSRDDEIARLRQTVETMEDSMLRMEVQIRGRPSAEGEPRPEPRLAEVAAEAAAAREGPKQAPRALAAGRASRAIRASGARPPVNSGDVAEAAHEVPWEEEVDTGIVEDKTPVSGGGQPGGGAAAASGTTSSWAAAVRAPTPAPPAVGTPMGGMSQDNMPDKDAVQAFRNQVLQEELKSMKRDHDRVLMDRDAAVARLAQLEEESAHGRHGTAQAGGPGPHVQERQETLWGAAMLPTRGGLQQEFAEWSLEQRRAAFMRTLLPLSPTQREGVPQR